MTGHALESMGASPDSEETEETSGTAVACLWEEEVKPPAALSITVLIFLFREVVKCLSVIAF